MRRREHTRDPELQARILVAATECFERVGLRRTTMDDVAQAAGVSRKTIYNYFANKTDLVGEVLVAESRRIHEQARAALDYSLPPDELIAAAEIAVLQVSKDSPYAGSFLAPDAFSLAADISSADERFRLVAENYWKPVLDHLDGVGVLRTDVSRRQMFSWLLATHIMCVSRAETLAENPDTAQETLRLFLAPALLAPVKSTGNVSDPQVMTSTG